MISMLLEHIGKGSFQSNYPICPMVLEYLASGLGHFDGKCCYI